MFSELGQLDPTIDHVAGPGPKPRKRNRRSEWGEGASERNNTGAQGQSQGPSESPSARKKAPKLRAMVVAKGKAETRA